jgi:hypothetical protein
MRHGSPRALGRAALVVAIVQLVVPAPALAHGLTGRADLPIPVWLFSWAAAAVLVLSFAALGALWSQPRLEGDAFRPLPAAFGRVLTSTPVQVACGAVGVALLLAVVVAGLAGAQVTSQNVTPTFVYVVFWLGLVPLSVVFGDVFALLNPWRAVGRAVGWLLRGIDAEPLAYPTWLGRWPAAAGLLAFAALELVSPYGDRPATVAYAALVYSSATWIAMSLFGVDAWTRRGEAFSVYFNLFSRLSVFEVRGRTIGTRPLLSGLSRLEILPGTVAVVMVMIGSVTFDGLSAGPTWLSSTKPFINDVADLGLGPRHAVELVYGAGLLVTVMIIAGLYRLAILGAHTVDRRHSVRELAASFAPSLVPIALAYAAAHYVSLLLFTGQMVIPLASDPLGRGWDLLGTADYRTSFFVSAEVFWYLQLAFVVAGHVAALVLAHDRALVLYTDTRRAARSQYWMLGIMVVFTVLALWLLSEASKG